MASFWGKEVPVQGPWAASLAATTTSDMYPSPPGFVSTGPGAVGSCATGTCGGSGGCGSETLGMCSAGCVGVSDKSLDISVSLFVLREIWPCFFSEFVLSLPRLFDADKVTERLVRRQVRMYRIRGVVGI